MKKKPWATSHFVTDPWTFQQDSAPAHRAKTTITWLEENVPAFITPSEWPPYSPDLNPMDFSIWSILERKVCCIRQPSVEVLKRRLTYEWNQILQEVLRTSCENFIKRLGLVISARGGHIER